MDGLLVFDESNDLIFKFINDSMKEKLYQLVSDMKLVRVSFFYKKSYLEILVEYLFFSR